MLGSVNVLLQYNKNILTTASCSRLSQLLIAVELCRSRRYSSRPSILVQCLNNNNYCQEQELRTTVQSGILDKCQGRYLEQQWIYAYRYHQYSTYSSMSIDQNIFDVHCPYQSFPISKLIVQCYQTNITRQQPMFQMLIKKSIATRLHEFFSCRRIQEELILFYFILFMPPKFIRDSPQFGQKAVRLSFPSCSPCYNIQKR